MVIVLDDQGRQAWSATLPAPVTALCAVGDRLLIAHREGMVCCNTAGRWVESWSTAAGHLARLNDKQVVAATLADAELVAFEP